MKRSSLSFILFLCFPVHAFTTNGVKIQGLDKVTGKVFSIKVKIDQAVKFGSLTVVPRVCHKNPPEESPESTAFIEIWEQPLKGDLALIFSRWMFASTPSLSALDHPVYDIWINECVDL